MYKRGILADKLFRERDLTLPMFAKKHNLNIHSLRNTIKGLVPVWSVAVWFAQNEPELFNLLPENSRKLVNGHYENCNIPRHLQN